MQTARARKLLRIAVVVLLAWPADGKAPASAQTAVDLHLVLAVDASGSVSEERFELQRRGYATAFRSPALLRAVQSGSAQAIAVTMVQWTGPAMQVLVVPWTRVGDERSASTLAAIIERVPRQLFGGGTSISGAIDHAMTLFGGSPFTGGRRVIDVSGDGRNNRGRPASEARDDAVRAGASINGLPILAIEPDLESFYRDNVIGGPGAFVIPAATFEAFGDAILKKLIIEISESESAKQLPVPIRLRPKTPERAAAPSPNPLPVKDEEREGSSRRAKSSHDNPSPD